VVKYRLTVATLKKLFTAYNTGCWFEKEWEQRSSAWLVAQKVRLLLGPLGPLRPFAHRLFPPSLHRLPSDRTGTSQHRTPHPAAFIPHAHVSCTNWYNITPPNMSTTKRQKMERSSRDNHQDNQDNNQDNQYNDDDDDDERKPAATGFVYYKVLVNDELSQASRVNVNIEDEVLVDTIKEAIKTRSSPEFDSVPIQRIELFESLEDIKQGNDPLDALEMWNSTVTWGTTAKPVIVKVPENCNSESPRSNSNNGEC
jgi:hypothetical protein